MKKLFLFIVSLLLLLSVQSFADVLPEFQDVGSNCGNPVYADGRWDNFNVSVKHETAVINGVTLPVLHYVIDGIYSPLKLTNLDMLKQVPPSVLKNMEIVVISKYLQWLVPKGTTLTTYARGEDNSWVINAVNCKAHTWIQYYIPGPSVATDNKNTLRSFGLLPGKASGWGRVTHKFVVYKQVPDGSIGQYVVDGGYAFYVISKIKNTSYNGYTLFTMSKITGDLNTDYLIFRFNVLQSVSKK
jgi:hypothetical protein